MHVYDFQSAVYCLDFSSICIISNFPVHNIVTLWLGGRKSVTAYASICMYFYVKYMHRHQSSYMNVFLAVHLAVFVLVCPTVFLAVFFVHTVTVQHCCFAFATTCARSLQIHCAVSKANLSRSSASAVRLPNSIRSGLRDCVHWTAAASGNLYRRTLAARWITTQRRRSDAPVTLKLWEVYQNDNHCWESGLWFLETTAHRNTSTGYQHKRLKITEIFSEWHDIAATAYNKETDDWWHMRKVTERKIATQDKLWQSSYYFETLKYSSFLKQQGLLSKVQ